MAVEFALPELGENVEKGDVVRVLVKPGDVVKKDQPVLELETDKATIEVPSSVEGTVSDVKVKAGDKVKVGQTVLVLESNGHADAKAAEPAPKADAKAESKPEPKADAKAESKPQPKAEPAPDAEPAPKSSSKHSGEVVDFAAARPGQPARAEAPSATPRRADPAAAQTTSDTSNVPAAPSVRRYARELGVDICAGVRHRPGRPHWPGRCDGLREAGDDRWRSGPGAVHAPALPDFSKWGAIETKPMSNIRRKTAEHLSIAWQAPHVTQHDRADVTELEAFRKTYGPRVEKAGGKLTVTAILIKLVAVAIDRFPQFASSVDMAHDAIVMKKYRHIGIAVDTPNGLLVPVIRDVDRKTIADIAVELGTVSQKARDKKLSLEEMSGGVFSISNLGGIGGTAFTPIVNQPEVAILGVSRGGIEPVWKDDQFVPREMLPLSLSYDHRVIDGADAARFLRWIAEALEQPMTMLL